MQDKNKTEKKNITQPQKGVCGLGDQDEEDAEKVKIMKRGGMKQDISMYTVLNKLYIPFVFR